LPILICVAVYYLKIKYSKLHSKLRKNAQNCCKLAHLGDSYQHSRCAHLVSLYKQKLIGTFHSQSIYLCLPTRSPRKSLPANSEAAEPCSTEGPLLLKKSFCLNLFVLWSISGQLGDYIPTKQVRIYSALLRENKSQLKPGTIY